LGTPHMTSVESVTEITQKLAVMECASPTKRMMPVECVTDTDSGSVTLPMIAALRRRAMMGAASVRPHSTKHALTAPTATEERVYVTEAAAYQVHLPLLRQRGQALPPE
jgi:citrate lyase beta subunit